MPNRIISVLDVSTANLPQEVCQHLGGFPGVIAHEHDEYGWLLWVPTDLNEPGREKVPAEVWTILVYARSHGCDYVLIDRDADAEPDLPRWDW